MLLRFIAHATCLDVARYILPRMLTECDKLMLFEAQRRVHAYTERHVEECARDGHVALMQHINTYLPIHKRAARLAAACGHIAIVNLCDKRYAKAMLYASAKHGHIDIAKHVSSFKPHFAHDVLRRHSVRSGNIELIKWLSDFTTYHINDARWALANGDIVTWDWFIACTPSWIRRATEHVRTIAHYDHVVMQGAEKTVEAFTNACRFGNLDLCKHMLNCDNPYHSDAFEAAGAHVHIMEWLKSIGIMGSREYSRPHSAAASAGCIDASRWLIANSYNMGPYLWHEAAGENHVQYMAYLHAYDISPGQSTGMYALVCKHMTTQTLDWLADECGVVFKIDWIIHVRGSVKPLLRAKQKWMIRRYGAQLDKYSYINPLHSVIVQSDDEMIHYILAHAHVDISNMLRWCAALTSQNPEKREKYDRVERALRSYTK
jgi:hypothetical protein